MGKYENMMVGVEAIKNSKAVYEYITLYLKEADAEIAAQVERLAACDNIIQNQGDRIDKLTAERDWLREAIQKFLKDRIDYWIDGDAYTDAHEVRGFYVEDFAEVLTPQPVDAQD